MKFQNHLILILFGSRARNDSNPTSDFDLVCLINHKVTENLSKILQKKARYHSTDLFIFDIANLENLLLDTNSILLDSFSEGILLFDGIKEYIKIKNNVETFIRKLKMRKTDIGWTRST